MGDTAVGGRTRTSGKWAMRAVVLLVLAVAAAGSAAVLLSRWVNRQIALARVPTATVVVAAVDLPVGTRLAAEHLQSVEWPAASCPESAVSDAATLQGQIVAVHIDRGEAVLLDKLVSGRTGGDLAALLPEGSRAVSVRVDDVVGVAGFIHPGDSVDVIVTMRPDEAGEAPFVSKTILQDIRVLAVGKEVDARARQGDRVQPATVATLQVDSGQAEKLALAANRGQILLALRGAADALVVETRGVMPRGLIATAPEPPPAKVEKPPEPPPGRPRIIARPIPKPEPPEVKPEPARPEKQVVEILRGDLFERRNFEKNSKESTP